MYQVHTYLPVLNSCFQLEMVFHKKPEVNFRSEDRHQGAIRNVLLNFLSPKCMFYITI